MLDFLQTVGICVGALALVAIAFSLLLITSSVTKVFDLGGGFIEEVDDEEEDELDDDDKEEVVAKKQVRRARDQGTDKVH